MFIMHEFTKKIYKKDAVYHVKTEIKNKMVQEGKDFIHFQCLTILTFVLFPSKK